MMTMTSTELANLIRTGMGVPLVGSSVVIEQLTAPDSADLDTEK